jgi:hypothetical protein
MFLNVRNCNFNLYLLYFAVIFNGETSSKKNWLNIFFLFQQKIMLITSQFSLNFLVTISISVYGSVDVLLDLGRFFSL